MSELSQTVTIVTGGGSGIGRAISEGFISAGGQVIISGRRKGPLDDMSDAFPQSVTTVVGDVTNAGDRKNIVRATIEKFGRIDVLINNAGFAPMLSLEETSDEVFQKTCLTNLIAPALLIRECLPYLKESKGCVVNVSTVAAQSVIPNHSAYVSSKAGLNHLTRVLAAELGPEGIRVNAVAPGATKTSMSEEIITAMGEETLAGMTALGRLGKPEDVAESVLYLASPQANWVTGQILAASGGFLL